MFGMNPEQLDKTVRTFLTMAGTVAMTLGWLTPEKVGEYTAFALSILGPILTLGTIVWTMVSGMQSSQVARVAAMPNVKQVVLDGTVSGTTALNKATPNNVVVG